MSTGCDIAKDNLEIELQNQEDREEFFDTSSAVRKYKNEAIDLLDILENEYPKGKFIDESIVNNKINKLYGKQSENKKLAIKIRAIMDGNESLAEYLHQFIIEHIGLNQRLGTAVEYEKEVVKENKKTKVFRQVSRHIVLSRLPLSTLKVIYNEALEPSRATTGIVLMNFNGILSPIMTPKQRGKKEKSGGYWTIQRATSKYADKIAHRISRFMSKRVVMKNGKEVSLWEGMTSVYERVEGLADSPLISKDTPIDIDERFTRLFSMIMSGRVLMIDGEFHINKDYGRLTKTKKIKGQEVEVTRRHDDKSAMYGWYNLVPLKDFTPPNKTKGEWFIDMNQTTQDELISLTEEARAIDDEVFKYMEKHMGGSLKELRSQLQAAFPNLSRNDVTEIFFSPDGKKAKRIISKLSKEDKQTYEELFDALGPTVNDEFRIATGHVGEKKKNHWPTIFNTDIYKSLLDKMIDNFDEAVNTLTDAVKSKKDSKGNDISSEQLKELRQDLLDYKSKKLNAETVRMRIDDYPVDLQNQILVGMARDNKYFKRITNAYDHRAARTDNGLYYDYLKNVMSSIERNYLAAELIKGLLQSKNINSPEMHKVVSKSMINLFKVPFHGTDIYRKGFLSRLFPKLGTVEGINDLLNKIPGLGLFSLDPFRYGLKHTKFYRNRTAAQLNKTYRIIASYVSGTYLSGLGTTVQNLGDALRNLMAFGTKTTKHAYDLLNNDERRKKIEAILEQSGILEFSDFFSQSMVNVITKSQLEAQVADKILLEMLRFWTAKSKIDKITNNKKRAKELTDLRQKFLDKVSVYLVKSDGFLKGEDFYTNMLSPEQIKYRRTENRQRRALFFTNKLVQFAITKEFVMKPVLKDTPLRKFGKSSASVIVEAYRKITTLGQKSLTMANTERYIRTLSFVIGAQRAFDAGLLRQDIKWYDSVTARDINEVIYYGRAYSEKMNFGLSTQATGEYNYNSMGNLMGKFKYWSQQKFGSDVRVFKEAYTSLKSIEKIEGRGRDKWYKFKSFDVKAVLKTIGMMFKGQKTLRITHPEVAHLKAFILTQGILTVAVDIATLTAGLPILRQVLYYGSGGKMLRGFTSDLVSLMSMPFMIAGMLLSGEWDDEEEYERAAKFYLRKTFFGFVPMWGFDNIAWMLQLFVAGNTKAAINGIIDASGVLRGGGMGNPMNLVNPQLKKLY